MGIRNLRTLVAVADRGSFAAAARAVGLTQSAVSMQLRGLEDELRIKLFDRHRRPPALNDHGALIGWVADSGTRQPSAATFTGLHSEM